MILASLSGILCFLAFSLDPLWWLSFAALVPLLLSLDRARTWKAGIFRITLFSVIYSSGMGYWLFNALMGHYRLPAETASMFFCLALVLPVWLIHLTIAVCYRFLNDRRFYFYALVVPALWVTGDYTKSMVPFLIPWGDVGYALMNWPAYFQTADLGGVYLISFLVVMFNALLAGLIIRHPATDGHSRRRWITGTSLATSVLLGLIIVLPLVYGSVRRHQMHLRNASAKPLDTVIVQGNFSPEDRWGGLGFYRRLQTYVELSTQSSAGGQGEVIIWPETVLNHPEGLTEAFFSDLAGMLKEGTLLIAGGLKQEPQQGVYNSVYLISAGRPLQRYDKHILLPYSETAPVVGPFLRFYNAPDRFLAGAGPACLMTPRGGAGISVCFEALYPGYIRRSVKQGAEFLVNVSNDSWFGDSVMPRSHLRAARARAVETKRWLLRASNSGFSAVIAPDGNVAAVSKLFCAQRISGTFRRLSETTVYTRWGDWVFFFSLIVLAAGFLRAGFRR